MNILLWIIQILLALLFLLAGGTKLALPADVLMSQGPPNQIVLPALFIKFIGLCEVFGALGLVLPGLFGIWPGLTPVAAIGLAIIMVGAVILDLAGPGFGSALLPFITLLLCIFVAYGRGRRQSAHT